MKKIKKVEKEEGRSIIIIYFKILEEKDCILSRTEVLKKSNQDGHL